MYNDVELEDGTTIGARRAPLPDAVALGAAFQKMASAPQNDPEAARAARWLFAREMARFTDRTPEQLALIFTNIADMMAVCMAVLAPPQGPIVAPSNKGIVL